MSELRDSGRARVSLAGSPAPEAPRDQLLEAVRETAGRDFEVFGEFGRDPGGAIAYLARDLGNAKLVALRLAPAPGRSDEYTLEVARQLDASMPAPVDGCPRCGAALRSWGRFCTQCGLNLWSAPAAARGDTSDALLAAVKDAVGERYAVLGEMSRQDGSGVVYFARNLATGKIEALRLLEEGGGFSIGTTRLLQRLITDRKPPR